VAAPHFLRPLLGRSPGPFGLYNTRTELMVASFLEGAFDASSRNRGLLGRPSLPAEHALILAPSSVVHTFFMKFPIDLLFVARDGRVLKLRRAVPSRRIAGALRAFAVIELAANVLERSGTLAGDRLSVVGAEKSSPARDFFCS
jgi:uncharacterized membrane protein (UPF0127 family)